VDGLEIKVLEKKQNSILYLHMYILKVEGSMVFVCDLFVRCGVWARLVCLDRLMRYPHFRAVFIIRRIANNSTQVGGGMDSDDSMIDIYPFLCCSLLSFAAVAIVTKRKRKRDNNNKSNNNNNMPPSSISNNNTSTNNKLRMVALCFISFAIGLQFKYAIELIISSESSSLNDEYSWAPDDMEVEWPERENNNGEKNEVTVKIPPKHRRNNNGYQNLEQQQQQNAVEETPRQRRRRKRREQAEEGSSAQPKKKKKHKAPRRYEASNYTNDFKPLPWSLPQPNILRDMSSETFMKRYIQAKHKHNITLPWDSEMKEKYRNKKVSLPLPIISLNFPKSATLTMKTYFDCGGLTSIHTSTQDGRIGIW